MIEASQILDEQGEMESARFSFESMWWEVASLMLPRQADFLNGTQNTIQGLQRSENIFDETAMQGLDHGSAVFEGEIIPQGGTWQKLKPHNEDLLKLRHVAEWYETLTTRLFALRNAAKSGFANQTHESVCSLLSFGIQGMTVDKRSSDPGGKADGLRYISKHIGTIYIREDATGLVETSHEKFTWTHRKALMTWGDAAPELALRARDDPTGKKLNDKATYIHRLSPMPSAIFDPQRIDYKGKPVASSYLCVDNRQVFEVGGFRTRPLTVSRYEKSPTEDYGRCPAISVLPAIRAAQEVQRDLITAINFMARPALGAHDDLLDQLIMYAPGGISYGSLNDRGEPLIRQLLENADISAAANYLAEVRKVIQRAFFEDLYIARQELKSHISATEQLQRDAQRGMLLGPLKRQEGEWFTMQVERELDLMAEMGMLNDMPQEVREEGGFFKSEYDNPLAIARQAGEASSFYTLLQGVTPLMQLDPENTVKEFFREYPFERILGGLSRIHGVSVSFRATDEEKQANDENARALADKASFLEVGSAAADIASKLGKAQPPPQPASGATA
jgi:hypothetical protein